jgi:hypothetical protein
VDGQNRRGLLGNVHAVAANDIKRLDKRAISRWPRKFSQPNVASPNRFKRNKRSYREPRKDRPKIDTHKERYQMETQRNPNEPGEPGALPGQQGGEQEKDRDKQERERQQREQEKQGGGGQQGGSQQGGR